MLPSLPWRRANVPSSKFRKKYKPCKLLQLKRLLLGRLLHKSYLRRIQRGGVVRPVPVGHRLCAHQVNPKDPREGRRRSATTPTIRPVRDPREGRRRSATTTMKTTRISGALQRATARWTYTVSHGSTNSTHLFRRGRVSHSNSNNNSSSSSSLVRRITQENKGRGEFRRTRAHRRTPFEVAAEVAVRQGQP